MEREGERAREEQKRTEKRVYQGGTTITSFASR
jgi:hypothetical protein